MSTLVSPGKCKVIYHCSLAYLKYNHVFIDCFGQVFILMWAWGFIWIRVDPTWLLGGVLMPGGGCWAKCFLIGLGSRQCIISFPCVCQNLECVSLTLKCPWTLIKDPFIVPFLFLSFSLTTVDSEDGVAIEAPGTLNLDTEFLLGHDLEFDQDDKILTLDKFSGV